MFSFHVSDSSPVWQTHLAGVDVGLNVSVSDGVYVWQLWSSNRRGSEDPQGFQPLAGFLAVCRLCAHSLLRDKFAPV